MTDQNQSDALRYLFGLERENEQLRDQLDALINHGDAPVICDIKKFVLCEPSPLRFVIPRWMPAGYATLLGAHGGTGKSEITLRLAICKALGLNYFGLPLTAGNTLYLSCEDREDVLHLRFSRICKQMQCDINATDGKLFLVDAVDSDMTLINQRIQPTQNYFWLKNICIENKIELLIVDGVSDIFAGDENKRGEVKRGVNLCASLVPGGAVLLIAHVNRNTATNQKTTEGYSGNTAWHNAVRARWYLSPDPDKPGSLKLELQKSNLGKSGEAISIKWDDEAHTFTGELIEPPTEFEKRSQDNDEQAAIVDALKSVYEDDDYCPSTMYGERSALKVLAARSEIIDQMTTKKADRKRFWSHIEQLRRQRLIIVGSWRRSNGHKAETLEPTGIEIVRPTPPRRQIKSNDNVTSAGDGAPPSASPRRQTQGGYRGDGREKLCKKCDGEGCRFCEKKCHCSPPRKSSKHCACPAVSLIAFAKRKDSQSR